MSDGNNDGGARFHGISTEQARQWDKEAAAHNKAVDDAVAELKTTVWYAGLSIPDHDRVMAAIGKLADLAKQGAGGS